ncbi:MAG: aspartate aminotransferase family protein [Polyangiaceae bacterium UTPRO1]|jgi:predicted acetylornithine/succinylornithine family transaminase|nr:aspartate aminotransferase family protein [Myxococcales bacterium]OQY69140.1 MAG: aspartate aminotransferase family protein [Polyangiaceae bacterium UTPRO1]
MSNQDIVTRSDRHLMATYARAPVAFVRGDGARLWDADGKEYLDLFACLAVTNLGHAPRAVADAVSAQAGRLFHVSNLHYCEPQMRLAELLCAHSFADRVFLCNSGAEANEAAIKLARRFGHMNGGKRFEVVSALGSFHGRTLATLTATGQEKVRVGFQPLPGGFRYVPYDDLAALDRALTDTTAALLLEPILGEGGVIVPRPEYLAGARKLCSDRGILLVLDEIQVGMGRTGTLFAHEQAGIVPDVMTLAKALASGIPIGACLARADVAAAFTAGSHGSTFGGNAIATAAAARTLEIMTAPGFLADVRRRAAHFRAGLDRLAARSPRVKSVRGVGFIQGIVLDEPGAPIVAACLERGVLLNCTADTVLRLLPPLVITEPEIDRALAIIEEVLAT